MENKVRYQYSYFIYPFTINNYKTYIYSLLKNKKIELKMFDLAKDVELYKYFLEPAKNYFFNTIQWKQEKRKMFENMDDRLRASILSKMGTCYFTHPLEKQIHGKIDNGGLFFTIDQITIVCNASRNCFLLVKTHIDNLENIKQVLNFNYKFRELQMPQAELQYYDKIRIQTTQFETSEEIQTILKEITNQSELRIPYVHSYVCLDSENWSKPEDFETLRQNYIKYINIQPTNETGELKTIKKEIINEDFAKMSIGKEGNFLFTSSIKSENYTKIPYLFEAIYLYTYLIRLEQKETLLTLFEEKWLNNTYNEWELLLIRDKITENSEIELFYHELGELWDIDLLKKLQKEYSQIQFQKEEIAKNKKWNKLLIIICLISIAINMYNLIINLRLFKIEIFNYILKRGDAK